MSIVTLADSGEQFVRGMASLVSGRPGVLIGISVVLQADFEPEFQS